MAIYGRAMPKTDVGKVFRKQLIRLKEHNKDEEKAVLNQENPQWYRPDDWEGAVFDIDSYHEPFKRDEQEDQFIEAVKDPDNPGTTGDMTMVEVQGDFLHVMERAFRARNFSTVRSRVQAAGRKFGHGHDNGVIEQGLLGYVVNVDRMNRGETV